MAPRAIKLLSRTVIRAVCSKNTEQAGGMGLRLKPHNEEVVGLSLDYESMKKNIREYDTWRKVIIISLVPNVVAEN